MPNETYTNLWTKGFEANHARRYDSKFWTRWEKNVKHRQQIAFIRNYLEPSAYWCDCPIGSGRLMGELRTERMMGYDISPSFIEVNQARGIECVQGDLFEFGDRFEATFDLVTSLHTLFAFNDYEIVLGQLVRALRQGGVLIVDLPNRNHAERTKEYRSQILSDPDAFPFGTVPDEINAFFEARGCEVLEVVPHDYWDNFFVLNWRLRGSEFVRAIKGGFWGLCNRAYFWFRLWRFAQWLEKSSAEHRFTKYLVAVRRKSLVKEVP